MASCGDGRSDAVGAARSDWADPRAPWGRRAGCTALAIADDGRTLAVGGRDRRVVRRDVTTTMSLGTDLLLDSPVGAIALTPDGRTVITVRHAGRLHIWDAGAERGFDLPPQGTDVVSLAVSADGRLLASGTEGGVVRLWDTSLFGQIGQTCKFAAAVTALAFDPRGRVLAIGGEDGTIRLREVPRRKALGEPLRVGHPVRTLTFVDGGRRLLVGTAEGSRCWNSSDLEAGTPGRCPDGRGDGEPSSPVEAAAVSPDGRTHAMARRAGSRAGRPSASSCGMRPPGRSWAGRPSSRTRSPAWPTAPTRDGC